MKSYELPNANGIYSTEDADLILNKIEAETQGDPEHPYQNREHPQHNDYIAAVTKIHKVKAEYQDEDEQPEIEFSEIPAQQRRAKEAERMMKILENHGYEDIEVSNDVTPAEIRQLKQFRMVAEGQYGRLCDEFEADLKDLGNPQDAQNLLHSIRNMPDDDLGDKSQMADRLIKFIMGEKSKKGYLL